MIIEVHFFVDPMDACVYALIRSTEYRPYIKELLECTTCCLVNTTESL